MRAMDVLGVRVELPSNQPVLLLRERDGHRCLPVWIGAAEASAIAFAQEGVAPPRPLTHDLLLQVVRALGGTLIRVRIVALEDNVFHARLDVRAVGGAVVEIDARTSDAIALALRAGVEITAPEEMLDQAGVTLPAEEGGEDEVERFKEFLDHVSPEDFDLGQPGGD